MRAIGHTLRLHQRGDTIVEVLISIAVISLVLGGAYVTTQRSLLASRDAQERGNALKLTEGQLEQLKNIASSSNASTLFGSGTTGTFCVVGGSIVSASNAGCAVDSAGQPTGKEPVYHLSATRSGNTFTVVNTWASLINSTNDNVQLAYRLYQ